MLWRGLVYLSLIAPLHYLLVFTACVPAALLMPPDVTLQLSIALPLYVAGLWWGIPLFQRFLGVSAHSQFGMRVSILLIGLLIIPILAVGVYFGIFTTSEAFVLGSAVIIICHFWLIRPIFRP